MDVGAAVAAIEHGLTLAKCRRCGRMEALVHGLATMPPGEDRDALVQTARQGIDWLRPPEYAEMDCERCFATEATANLGDLAALVTRPAKAAEVVDEDAPVVTVMAASERRPDMDSEGYFVILPRREDRTIVIEHYAYDHRLLHRVVGDDARRLCATLLDNGWIGNLSHAAYLGRELTLAEVALATGLGYVQDGA